MRGALVGDETDEDKGMIGEYCNDDEEEDVGLGKLDDLDRIQPGQ